MKKKIMVIGGGSFVARHFKEHVFASHADEIASWLSLDKDVSLDDERVIEEVLNVLDDEALGERIADFKPDYIVNFVGTFARMPLNDLIRINAGVSNAICEAVLASENPVEKLLFIGSAAEYGIPASLPVSEKEPLQAMNAYGVSKAVQAGCLDYHARAADLPVCLARTFNIIGRGISDALAIGAFVKRITAADPGGEIKVGGLDARRDYLDVRDVVAAYWDILSSGEPGGVYNVCRGESVSMREILEEMIRVSGKPIRLAVEESLKRRFDVPDIHGDNRRLRELNAWNPRYSLEESVAELFDSCEV